MQYVGLDLSTKTGYVRMNENGDVLELIEIEKKGKDPFRMIDLIDEVMGLIKKGDIIILEGFGFSSRQGVMLGGIGWGIRMAIKREGMKYGEISPNGLKKFATGSGQADKRKLAVEVNKRWGFYNDSDNVTDAYVLAQVGRAIKGEFEPIKQQKEALQKVLFI